MLLHHLLFAIRCLKDVHTPKGCILNYIVFICESLHFKGEVQPHSLKGGQDCNFLSYVVFFFVVFSVCVHYIVLVCT